MWEQLFQVAIPAIVSAAAVGVPLYMQVRKLNDELRQSKANAELEVKKKAQEITETDKINVEASWKRIIGEKDAELIRLRSKDDEQELKIGDLLTRHIECKQNEARQDERAKFFEKRSEEQGREMRALMAKLLQLEKLVREKLHAFVDQSGSLSGEAVQAQ